MTGMTLLIRIVLINIIKNSKDKKKLKNFNLTIKFNFYLVRPDVNALEKWESSHPISVQS